MGGKHSKGSSHGQSVSKGPLWPSKMDQQGKGMVIKKGPGPQGTSISSSTQPLPIANENQPPYQRRPDLFESEVESDVIFLVGVEPKVWRLPAHKSILAQASPVFSAMLNGPFSANGGREGGGANAMPSGSKEEVPIKDIQPKAFENVLRFIYTGDLRLTSIDLTLDTLYAAEKYIVAELVSLCIVHLEANLNVNNVLNVLSDVRLYADAASGGGGGGSGAATISTSVDCPSRAEDIIHPAAEEVLQSAAAADSQDPYTKLWSSALPPMPLKSCTPCAVSTNPDCHQKPTSCTPSSPLPVLLPAHRQQRSSNPPPKLSISSPVFNPWSSGTFGGGPGTCPAGFDSPNPDCCWTPPPPLSSPFVPPPPPSLRPICPGPGAGGGGGPFAVLLSRCYAMVDDNAEHVLASEDFEGLSEADVARIVFRDTLRPSSELSVWKALQRWASHQCKAGRLAMTAENKRKVLGGTLYAPRFLLMDKEDEFMASTGGPFHSDLLEDDEKEWLVDALDRNKKSKTKSGDDGGGKGAQWHHPVLSDRKEYLERRRTTARKEVGLLVDGVTSSSSYDFWSRGRFGSGSGHGGSSGQAASEHAKKKKRKNCCKLSKVTTECLICFSLFFD